MHGSNGAGVRDTLSDDDLDACFPMLRATGFDATSAATDRYNCIAWAAGDASRWWWPAVGTHAYWPKDVPSAETMDAFVAAFESLGYLPCETAALETGVEKVALFADPSGVPTHAARQLPNGRWTSKLGEDIDISHAPNGLDGPVYGRCVRYLARPSHVPGEPAR